MKGLELCFKNINNWMNSNRLKMNDKTEFTCFQSRQQLTKCITQEINVLGTAVKRMEGIHYLGTLMDTTLTFKNHNTHVCKKAMINRQKDKTHKSMVNQKKKKKKQKQKKKKLQKP